MRRKEKLIREKDNVNREMQDVQWVNIVSGFPRKHAHSAPAAPIARVRLRNFCFAKDRASSPHDGLPKENPTLMLYGDVSGFKTFHILHFTIKD